MSTQQKNSVEKKKEKTLKRKKKTATRSKKKKQSVKEKIRDVIKGKRPLTHLQVMQFLSGVVDGDVKDDLTKTEAGIQEKLTASKILLDEYRKGEETKTQGNLEAIDKKQQTDKLIEALNDRVVRGFNDELATDNEIIDRQEEKDGVQ